MGVSSLLCKIVLTLEKRETHWRVSNMISQILSVEIKQGKDSAGGGVVSRMGQTAWTKSGSEQGGR